MSTLLPGDSQRAWIAGYEAGRNAGSWVIDGNTSDTVARQIFDQIADCDCDLMPAPLSGEWAGESIVELSDWAGVDLSDDELADYYEDGYRQGWEKEVVDAAVCAMTPADA